MKYKIDNIDNSIIDLTLNLDQDDYKNELDVLIKKKKRETDIKGFRKGMAPDSFIRRHFGNQILLETINKKIDELLSEALKEGNINTLLSPILKEDQEPLDLDINNLKDYKVIFQICKKPEAEIKGISEEDIYVYYKISPDEEIINKEIERLSKHYGHFESYEGEIDNTVMITISAKELDGESIKERGYDTQFTSKVADLTDEIKETLSKLKKNDKFRFDIYKFLNNSTDEKVKDMLLNIDENDFKEGEDIGIGNMFEGTIINTETFVNSELTPEIIKNLRLPEVNTEEDYRAYIRNDLQKYYDDESSKFLHVEIAEKLKELNQFEFPQEYIVKWVEQNYHDKSEEEKKKIIDNSPKDLQWQIIIGSLLAKYPTEVSDQEIEYKLYQNAAGIFGNNPEMISNMINYMKSDQKYMDSALNELYIDKLFGQIENLITKENESVTLHEFNEIASKYKTQLAEDDDIINSAEE